MKSSASNMQCKRLRRTLAHTEKRPQQKQAHDKASAIELDKIPK